MNDVSPIARDLHARAAVRALVASEIREVANAGLGDPDILAFWFGEPDEVTPMYIRDAAIASLAAGETFYTQNFGIPELREAIATYLSRLHRPVAAIAIAPPTPVQPSAETISQATSAPAPPQAAIAIRSRKIRMGCTGRDGRATMGKV